MTEKRTAEEILRSVGNGVISKSVVINAMHEYAAQELSEYKKVIEELMPMASSCEWMSKDWTECQLILERARKLINKL